MSLLYLFSILSLSLLPATTVQADQTARPPKGAIVLFTHKPEELAANWLKRGADPSAVWEIKEGAAVTGGGDLVTKQLFSDCQLHVEFCVPLMEDKKGQARGNSGVKLQGRYEIQILDSYGVADPGTGDCGAVYTVAAPLVNACKPPEEWQTYDIVFRSPRTDSSGAVTEKGRVSVWQNGILVQNNTEIPKPTGSRPLDREVGKSGPILLQDHGCRVRFRNIWVLPLPAEGAKHY